MVTYPMFRARLVKKLKNSAERGAQTGEKRGAVAGKWVRGRALRCRRAGTRGAGLGTPASAHDRNPAPGTGADPPVSAHVRSCDPGHGPGHASQRARPRPPSRAPTRAGQRALSPRSAPPERDGRRIMGHFTSREKMHRGAVAPY